ncbi:MAG TPA: Nramp family divalent metal transporter [Gemmatimonadaceae bacterium]|nr:Nramp family divalent metal transporter [Gemmatimonadaceae bacterium]
MTSRSPLIALLKATGPGLLMAGAAIGVSHLVQSTRAGADFGYQLIVVVILINLLKYPFFEYGHRYAVATGENLLDGYRRMGPVFLYAFLLLAAITAVGSIAGVTFVTAGLVQQFAAGAIPPVATSVGVMLVCVVLLVSGHYKALDTSMKVIMAVLVVATVVSVIASLSHGAVAPPDFVSPSPWTMSALPFLIALMGWMPAPIEISVFQSLWIQAKDQASGRRTTREEAHFDFNFGYILTIVLAILFVALGALVMHGSGLVLQNSSGGFATQLVQVYTQVLGSWAGPVIGISAFATMFSTTLTVIDGYPRALAVGTHLVTKRFGGQNTLYLGWMAITCAAGLMLITKFASTLTGLVDLVTTMAFLSAPIAGYLNYRLITSDHTPAELRPGGAMRALSLVGLVFFAGFSLFFLWFRFLRA